LGGDTIVLQSDLVAEIADSLLNYVNISGTQTITGAKTFSTDVEIDGRLDLNVGQSSVYIGANSGVSDDGSNNLNIAVGNNAMASVTSGFQNVAIGASALNNLTTTSNNMAVGTAALRVNQGQQNVAIGASALLFDSTGSYNTVNGYQALYNNNGGSYNVALGHRVGRYYGSSTQAASKIDNSVLIGYDARPLGNEETNQIVIGYQARGLGTNTAIIGNGSLTDIYNGADNANFSTVSDARDKTNIEPLELGLNLIENLNPVAFVWDKRDSTRVGVKDIGFIAQEFDGALYALPHSDYADFVKITEDGSWKLNLSDIYPVIVKAIQEQQAIIESQTTEIEQLKTIITELSNRLTILENN
jgi:hypothetical protein